MAIHIEPGRYYLAMWYVEISPADHPPRGGNWMGCVHRAENEPNKWMIQYRHRYYSDETTIVFGKSKDRFSWYEATIAGTEEQVSNTIDEFASRIALMTGSKFEKFIIQGDVEKYMKLAASDHGLKWLNVRLIERKKPT